MTGDNRYGAYPSDWQLLIASGCGPDLLPVVSNPGALVSPSSNLKTYGKTPSLYNKSHEVVGIAGWTGKEATKAELTRWQKIHDYGICLQTRLVRGIDIDITNANIVEQVTGTIEGILDCRLPVRRRGDSAKCLLALKVPGDLRKRVLETEWGNIEFLGSGNQFIAFGTHPSGSRYAWDWKGWKEGDNVTFPIVTREQLEEVWRGLAGIFGNRKSMNGNGADTGEYRKRNGRGEVAPGCCQDPVAEALALAELTGDVVRGRGREGEIWLRCPWEDAHSVDSGPSATAYFPAGGRGYETGHFKCLHAHCSGRTDAEFVSALGLEAALYEDDFAALEEENKRKIIPAAAGAHGAGGGNYRGPMLLRSDGGEPLPLIDNICRALEDEQFCGWRFGFDTFKASTMAARTGDATWSALADIHYTAIQRVLERDKQFRPIAFENLRRAVDAVAWTKRFDSAQQWLQGLTWDGAARVERFFSHYLHCEDTEYTRAVGLYLWTALAARVAVPGIKIDMVPVLVGREGVRKSSMVAAIAPLPEMFTEISFDEPDDKLVRKMQGRLVAEITELRGLGYNKEKEWIRAFITRQVEEWVPKYKERPTTFARRLVFIASTNDDEILTQDAEERRWLPLNIEKDIAVDDIIGDRDQLWAEGFAIFSKYGVLHADAQRLMPTIKAEYTYEDSWIDVISAWLENKGAFGEPAPCEREYVTCGEILSSALQIASNSLKGYEGKRVGKCLKVLGYKKHVLRVGGRNTKVWIRKK